MEQKGTLGAIFENESALIVPSCLCWPWVRLHRFTTALAGLAPNSVQKRISG